MARTDSAHTTSSGMCIRSAAYVRSLLLVFFGLSVSATATAQPDTEAEPGAETAAPDAAAAQDRAEVPDEAAARGEAIPGEATGAESSEAAANVEQAEARASDTEPTGEASSAATQSDVVIDTSGSGLFEETLAGGTETAAEETTAGASSAFDLNGYVRGDVFVGKVPGASDPEIKAAYGELALRLNAHRQRYGDAFAEARLRYGQQGNVNDLFIDLREAYVNAYLGPLDLRVGHQIVVWGRADAFNPTNNVTPVDLRVRSPVEDDRRLGNVGVRAFLNLQPVRIEGVWMPLYRPVEIPHVNLPEFVEFGEPTYPAPKLENGLGAGRVHLELPDIEMSVSYLYGYAPMPGLGFGGFDVGRDATVFISRSAYNHHVIGFDFSTAIGEAFALRGEAAYRSPVNYEEKLYAPNPEAQYVVGVDRSFGSVNIIAQYVGKYVFDWEKELPYGGTGAPSDLQTYNWPPPDNVTAAVTTAASEELELRNQILFQQTEELQHMASLRIEWRTLHDTLSLSALGLLNVTTEEWLLYPKLAYQLSDSMSTTIGGEIYAGPEGSLLDIVDETLSAGYAELRFSF